MPNIFEVLSHLPLPAAGTILEIGAAQCEDTLRIMVACSFREGRYFAFEPEPSNLEVAKQSLSYLTPWVTLLPVAVGNENRMATFCRCNGWNSNLDVEHTFSGSLREPKKHLEVHSWCKFDRTCEVPMVRLDDVAELFSIGEVGFIWCDVQGAEDLIIEGGREVLARTKFFYTEYSNEELYAGQPTLARIQSLLGDQWRILKQWDNDVLFCNTAYESCAGLLTNPEEI